MNILAGLFGGPAATSDTEWLLNLRTMDAAQQAGVIQYLEQRIDSLSFRIAELEKKLAEKT